MCGVAGFSIAPDSKINVRALSNSLLTAIESRGYMASGFAWAKPGGDVGYYKQAVLGSQLSIKSMPKDSKSVILHTRLATQGSVEDNRNNHPVVSPDSSIALVHNGVIWNDGQIRRQLVSGEEVAEVDTAVIPALLQEKGLAGLQELAGDAAIAWLDIKDSARLHMARIEHSPMCLTWLEDGSMVFASTPHLLAEALDRLNLKFDGIVQMEELDYLIFQDGNIVEEDVLPEPKGFRYGYSSSTRYLTSGGGYGSLNQSGVPSEDKPKAGGIGSSFFNSATGWDAHWDEEMGDYEWSKAEKENDDDTPMALDSGATHDFFYMVSHWGDYTSYETLDELQSVLASFSQLNIAPNERLFPGAPLECQFIERVADIGYIDDDEGTDWSWVADRGTIEEHNVPEFIREGVHYMQKFGAIV